LLNNINDDPAFIRAVTTPKRGIGAVALEMLGTYSGRRGVPLFEAVFETGFAQIATQRQIEPLTEFVEFINTFEERARLEEAPEVLDDLIKAIGYEVYLFDQFDERQAQNKWKNVVDFVAWMKRRAEEDDKKLSEVIQSMVLISMLDKGSEDANSVRLSTLHASKGLEYPHVFLVGIEEGLLPHMSRDEALEDPTRIEEERRLMYVGITRARKSLHITWCQKRRRGRDFENREASRFIKEMAHDKDAQRGDLKEVPQITPKQRIEMLKAMLAKQAGQQELPFKPLEEKNSKTTQSSEKRTALIQKSKCHERRVALFLIGIRRIRFAASIAFEMGVARRLFGRFGI
jgi:ATP-dependent DNA helicase Rep